MFLFTIFILLQEEVPILGNVGPRDNCGSTYVRLGDNALYVVGACRGRVEGGRGGGGRGYLGSPAKTGFFRSGWLEGFKTIGGRRALPIPKTYFPAPLVSVLPCVPAARVMSGWNTSCVNLFFLRFSTYVY